MTTDSRFDLVEVEGGLHTGLPVLDEAAQVQRVPVAWVVRGDNDRTEFDEAELAELAESIRTQGLVQPVTVRPVDLFKDGVCRVCYGSRVSCACETQVVFEIVAGERRYRAVKLLRWEFIEAIVRELTDEQASEIMLIENVHRVDLNPMDEARAYQRRIEKFAWSIAEVALRAKKGVRHVEARLALLTLVPEAQELVRSKQMPIEWGELTVGLDANRQRLALRYLTTSDRPLKREYQSIVGKLMVEQAQQPMFGDGEVFQRTGDVIEAALDEEAERKREFLDRRFPVDEGIPKMVKTGPVGHTLESYIVTLMTSGDEHQRASARVVGRIYQSMLETGMCFPPRDKRGRPLDQLDASNL